MVNFVAAQDLKDMRSYGIVRHVIDLILKKYSGHSTWQVTHLNCINN